MLFLLGGDDYFGGGEEALEDIYVKVDARSRTLAVARERTLKVFA